MIKYLNRNGKHDHRKCFTQKVILFNQLQKIIIIIFLVDSMLRRSEGIIYI